MLIRGSTFCLLVSSDLEPSLRALLVGCSQIILARTAQNNGDTRFPALQTEITNPAIFLSFLQIHLNLSTLQIDLERRTVRDAGVPTGLLNRINLMARGTGAPELAIVWIEGWVPRLLLGVGEAEASVALTGGRTPVRPCLNIYTWFLFSHWSRRSEIRE